MTSHVLPSFRISALLIFFLLIRLPPISTLFPYTTLFRSLTYWTLHSAQPRRKPTKGEADHEPRRGGYGVKGTERSEEHTSELQSRVDLVCRLLLEKKK